MVRVVVCGNDDYARSGIVQKLTGKAVVEEM